MTFLYYTATSALNLIPSFSSSNLFIIFLSFMRSRNGDMNASTDNICLFCSKKIKNSSMGVVK